MTRKDVGTALPLTKATRGALCDCKEAAVADLLLLESWAIHKPMHLGMMLRVRMIRQANPGLLADIESELALQKSGRTSHSQEQVAVGGA